ncbi:hypothetical protein STEG23_025614 [Scotinomys teguina]
MLHPTFSMTETMWRRGGSLLSHKANIPLLHQSFQNIIQVDTQRLEFSESSSEVKYRSISPVLPSTTHPAFLLAQTNFVPYLLLSLVAILWSLSPSLSSPTLAYPGPATPHFSPPDSKGQDMAVLQRGWARLTSEGNGTSVIDLIRSIDSGLVQGPSWCTQLEFTGFPGELLANGGPNHDVSAVRQKASPNTGPKMGTFYTEAQEEQEFFDGLYVYGCNAHRGPKRALESPGIGVSDSCEPPVGIDGSLGRGTSPSLTAN